MAYNQLYLCRKRPASPSFSDQEEEESVVAIMVGAEEGEMRRVEVRVENLNHALFQLLLLEDEEEEGGQEECKFNHTGIFHICCDLDLFLYVNHIIDKRIRI